MAGFNWNADPTSKDFYSLRANLIHGTISAVLPNVYARNPEISTAPLNLGADLKLFCRTLEAVTNRALEHAQLKNRAKSTVRAALTCSYGILKVMYQRDPSKDSYIKGRINDAQENLLAIQDLEKDLHDNDQAHHHDVKRAELDQLIGSLYERSEVKAQCFYKYLTDPFYMQVFVQTNKPEQWQSTIESIYDSIGTPEPSFTNVKINSMKTLQPIRARTSTLGAPLASSENPMDRIAQHLGNMGI